MKTYENYPALMIIVSNVVSLSIYIIGTYILLQIGALFAVAYLLYCLWVELKVIKTSCRNCYYYGKLCCFGKGKICSSFFEKGNPKKFAKRDISMKDIVPDFLVSVFPIIGAVIILFTSFSWLILTLLAVLIILAFAGSAFVRGSLACKYCKQREKGCPAEKMFRKRR